MRTEAVLSEIRRVDPDIVALQEVTLTDGSPYPVLCELVVRR
jgi:endonuclease/exonuclease/phosphatase family metal-dependent hydrolase